MISLTRAPRSLVLSVVRSSFRSRKTSPSTWRRSTRGRPSLLGTRPTSLKRWQSTSTKSPSRPRITRACPVRSVSLTGPFLAITTFYSDGLDLANDKSQIWVQDLRTLGDELSLIEVPAPTGDEWVTTGIESKPMIVSIFYTQMMVTITPVRKFDSRLADSLSR